MALIIPREYIPAMNKIRNLPDSFADSLQRALSSSPITSHPRDMALQITERVPDIPTEDLSSIVDALYTLYHVREYSDLNRNSFLKELFETVKKHAKPPITEVEAPRIFKRIHRLLNIKTLDSLSKAITLQREGERLYCSARIISDIRPVFGSDVESKPVAAVITHTLNLVYHKSGGRHKEFFVVLDSADLVELHKIINRAQKKSETLDQLLAGSGLPRLGV